ncbi:1-phosphofructokinase [soil metagenome]
MSDPPPPREPASDAGAQPCLVLTVTPNPSLDLLFETDELVWDDANRMADPRRRPGGQGINVVRAVRALGGHAVAMALLGGRTGAEIAAALAAEGAILLTVEADGESRTFAAVRERDTGRSLLLNARGPARTREDALRLLRSAESAIHELRPRWVACCGSLPPGFPTDFYLPLIAAARSAGSRVVVDCDGDPLRLAAHAGCDLLVPNEHEAARLCSMPVSSAASAARAALTLHRAGTPSVAVTLGREGAVLAAAGRCWLATPPPLSSGSAVGACDAFLAGLLVAMERGCGPPDSLRLGVAAGASTLLSVGGELLSSARIPEVLDRISLQETNFDSRLD